MKLINFNSHIKKLQGELDLNKIENEDNNNLNRKESNTLVAEDSMGMKDLINKKRKHKRDKKTFEFSEDMLNEQMELFEKSKMETMQNILMTGAQSANANSNNINTQEENALLKEDNKKVRLDIMEKNLFANDKKAYEEDVDFD